LLVAGAFHAWLAVWRDGSAVAWTSLNREEAEHGIRATAISPGFVATRMTEWTGLPAEEQISPDDIVALVRAVLSLSPMARVPNIVVERLGDTY
jgi:NAD(P)-dependent dehydrogenase (short-subunit alcohol dehydrogenase family)